MFFFFLKKSGKIICHTVTRVVFCVIAHLRVPYLNVVVSVVVEIEHPVDLGVATDLEILDVFHALRDSLSRVFLHLNIVELPAIIKNVSVKITILLFKAF